MGSASYRYSALKNENLLVESAILPSPRRDSLVRQGSLQRAFSRAKDAIYRRRAPAVSATGLEHSEASCIRDQMPIQDMEEPRHASVQGYAVEIIEILDDDSENESASVDSYSDARASLASVSIQPVLSPVSPENRELREGHGSGLARLHEVEDDDWGFGTQNSSPEHVHHWDEFSAEVDAAVSATRPNGLAHDNDWREFLDLDNDDASIGNPPVALSPESVFGLNDQRQANHQFGNAPDIADTLARLKVECVDDVVVVFPDICRDYVNELYDTQVGETAEQLIAHILDKLDKDTEYPKAKDKLKTLKRKRVVDEDEEAVSKYGNIDRAIGSPEYTFLTRSILSGEFPLTPMSFIDTVLQQTRHLLFPSYMILEEADRIWDSKKPPYNKIKKPRTNGQAWTFDKIDSTLKNMMTTPDTVSVLRELQAARKSKKNDDDKRNAIRQAEIAEEENFQKAETEGTLLECACCFSDYPLNRMVHCDNDAVPHWFCRQCARQTAETEIGNSKYKIKCMSMDGCVAGFSRHMKSEFLDEKISIALDRNEQEDMLRMAGIENLASCPFCPFAAEYPPVEQDRLFRCQAPDCEKVSCRLCKLESHIPKTCEEFAKENGLSIRRQIEEAMSAALIRRCNKCNTPFVKEEGCNKMTCTRSGCYNVQCYVCSKSCSYDHFNDRSRGGKLGNCPLFEIVEERHQEEVKKAEKEALAKVRAEHPEYTEDDLKVKVSENVRKDEEKRKTGDPRNNLQAGAPLRMPVGGIFALQPQVPGPHPGHGARQSHIEARPVLVPNAGSRAALPEIPAWDFLPEQVVQLQAPPVGQRAEIPDPLQRHNLDGEWLFPARVAGRIPGTTDSLGWNHAYGGDLAVFQGDVDFLPGYPAGLPQQANPVQIPAAQGPAAPEIPERGVRFFHMPHLVPAGGASQQAAHENPPLVGALPGIPSPGHDFHNQLLQVQQLQQAQVQLHRAHQIQQRQADRLRHLRNVEELQARINPPLQVQPVPPMPGQMPLRLSPRR